MENQVLSFEEIKKLFPDEWVLLGNPGYTDTDILSGIVIMHNKDKGHIISNRPNNGFPIKMKWQGKPVLLL